MKIEAFADAQKQEQMFKLLQFGTVMIFIDSRHSGVTVPEHLKNDHQLRLNFDYAYEIDDFRILPDRLEASLSFNKKNFFCVVPLSAVYLMICHGIQYGAVFADSVPSEMLKFFPQNLDASEAQLQASVVGDKPSGASPLDPLPSGDSPQTTRKGHLRLIK